MTLPDASLIRHAFAELSRCGKVHVREVAGILPFFLPHETF